MSTYDASGSLLSTRLDAADGTYTIALASGVTDAYRADGTLSTETLADGTVTTYAADGVRVLRTDRTDGSYDVFTYAEDGSSVVRTYDAQERETAVARYDASQALIDRREEAADGSYRMVYASGLEESFRADDSLSRRAEPGGDVTLFEADGVRPTSITHADGTSEVYDWQEDGSRQVSYRDAAGLEQRAYAYDADSMVVWTRLYAADRSWTMDFAGGTHEAWRADATLSSRSTPSNVTTAYEADGVRLASVTQADGSRQVYTWAEGGGHTVSYLDAAGVEQQRLAYDATDTLVSTRVRAEDGSSTVTWTSGQVDHYRADETLSTQDLPDGEHRIYLADGTRLSRVEHEDGTHEVYLWAEDGMHTVSFRDAQDAQLRILSYDGSGALLVTRTALPDGGTTVVYQSGVVETLRPDGTLASRLQADGTTLETYDTDGTTLLELRQADGVRRVYVHVSDGTMQIHFVGTDDVEFRTELYDATGALAQSWACHEDGSITRIWVPGPTSLPGMVIREDTDASGALQLRSYRTGVTQHYAESGAVTLEETVSGVRRTFHPDTSLSIDLGNGITVSVAADGTVQAMDGSGLPRIAQYNATTRELWVRDPADTFNQFRVAGDLSSLDEMNAHGACFRQVWADASRTVYRANCVLRTSASGEVLGISFGGHQGVRQPDGTWSLTWDDGTVQTHTADGTLFSLVWASGAREEYDTLGRVVRRVESNGDVTLSTYDVEGRRHALYHTGTVEVFALDGSLQERTQWGVTAHFVNGVETEDTTVAGFFRRLNPDDSQFVDLGNGITVTIASNGTAQATDASGASRLALYDDTSREVRVMDPTGTFAQYRVSGDLRCVEVLGANGQASVRLYANGDHAVPTPYGDVFFNAEGVVLRIESGGTSAVQQGDGTWLLAVADGGTVTFSATGQLLHRSRPMSGGFAIEIAWNEDGSYRQTITYASGQPASILDFRANDVLARSETVGQWTGVYDEQGRPTHTTGLGDNSDYEIRFAYDEQGRQQTRWLSVQYGNTWRETLSDYAHDNRLLESDTFSWDGSCAHVVQAEDGTQVRTIRNGAGRLLQTDTVAADGSYLALMANGDQRSYNAEGHLTSVLKMDGVVDSYGTNGLLQTRTHPDGVVETFNSTGFMATRVTPGVGTSTFARSTTETGVTLETRPDGMTGHIHDDGTTEVLRADGTLAERDLPGSIVEIYDAAGVILTRTEPRTGTSTYVHHEDGTMTRTFPDGAVQEYRADGTASTLTRADEAVVSFSLAGTLESVVFADSRTGTYVQSADGSYILTISDGVKEFHRADDSLGWLLRAEGTWEISGPDGRVTADGSTDGVSRTREYHADGSWTSTVSDDSVEEHAADGHLLSTTWPDGRVVTYPGGTTTSVTTWPNGVVMTVLADTTTTWTTPQGVTITRDAEGVVAGTASDETVLVGTSLAEGAGVQVTLVDGSLFQVLSDSGVQHLTADGTTPIETLDATGVDTLYVAGIQSRVTNADGSYETYSSDGTLLCQHGVDGSTSTYQFDGSAVSRDATSAVTDVTTVDGDAAVLQADGTWEALSYDGTRSRFAADGSPVSVVSSDGSVRTYAADHGATVVATDGSSQLYRADGTLALVVAADGARTECDLDGMPTTTTHLSGRVDTWLNGAVASSLLADGSTITYQVDGSARQNDSTGLLVSVTLQDGTAAVLQTDDTWSATAIDGTVSTFHVDGTPNTLTFSDGAVLEYLADGVTRTTTLANVVTTVAADGRTTVVHPDGTTMVQETGGDVQITDPDGIVRTFYASGTMSTHYLDDTVVGQDAGVITATFSDGHILLRDAQGRLSEKASATATATPYTGSTPVVVSVGGNCTLTWSLDGTFQEAHTDGRLHAESLGGRVRDVDASGVETIQFPSGTTRVTAMDETTLVTLSDGTKVGTALDETVTVTLPDGSTIVTPVGGTPTVTLATASTATANVDGSVTLTDAADSSHTTTWTPDGTMVDSQYGTTTTWHVDGTRVEVSSYGTTSTDAWGVSTTVDSDEITTVTAVDGTVTVTRPDGTGTITSADGSTTTIDAQGNHFRRLADGITVETTLVDGSTVTRALDGTVTAVPASTNPILAQEASGAWTAALADGSTITWHVDGAITTVTSAGTQTTEQVDRTVIQEKTDGTRITRLASGRLLQTSSDGAYVVQNADGSRQAFDSSGVGAVSSSTLSTRYSVDGSQTRQLADGTIESRSATGVVSQTGTDGSVYTSMAAGVQSVRNPNGSQSITIPGTTINLTPQGLQPTEGTGSLESLAFGNYAYTAADGTRVSFLRAGTSVTGGEQLTPEASRASLVRLDSPPPPPVSVPPGTGLSYNFQGDNAWQQAAQQDPIHSFSVPYEAYTSPYPCDQDQVRYDRPDGTTIIEYANGVVDQVKGQGADQVMTRWVPAGLDKYRPSGYVVEYGQGHARAWQNASDYNGGDPRFVISQGGIYSDYNLTTREQADYLNNGVVHNWTRDTDGMIIASSFTLPGSTPFTFTSTGGNDYAASNHGISYQIVRFTRLDSGLVVLLPGEAPTPPIDQPSYLYGYQEGMPGADVLAAAAASGKNIVLGSYDANGNFIPVEGLACRNVRILAEVTNDSDGNQVDLKYKYYLDGATEPTYTSATRFTAVIVGPPMKNSIEATVMTDRNYGTYLSENLYSVSITNFATFESHLMDNPTHFDVDTRYVFRDRNGAVMANIIGDDRRPLKLNVPYFALQSPPILPTTSISAASTSNISLALDPPFAHGASEAMGGGFSSPLPIRQQLVIYDPYDVNKSWRPTFVIDLQSPLDSQSHGYKDREKWFFPIVLSIIEGQFDARERPDPNTATHSNADAEHRDLQLRKVFVDAIDSYMATLCPSKSVAERRRFFSGMFWAVDGKHLEWFGKIVDRYLANVGIVRMDPHGDSTHSGWDYYPPTQTNCWTDTVLRLIGPPLDSHWCNGLWGGTEEVLLKQYEPIQPKHLDWRDPEVAVGDVAFFSGHVATVYKVLYQRDASGRKIAATEVWVKGADGLIGGAVYKGNVESFKNIGYNFKYIIKKPTKKIIWEIRPAVSGTTGVG